MKKTDFKVTLWGTQGTTAVSTLRKKRYGSNTPCVSVECGECIILFDMGTGLLPFSDYFLKTYQRPKTIDIFISHYHLDHIEGLPFAGLTYTPDVNIRFHGLSMDGKSPVEILSGVFSPPYFPGDLFGPDKAGRFTFDVIQPGQVFRFADGAVVIEQLLVPHPGSSLSFKLKYNGRSFCYLSDFEYRGDLSEELIAYLDGCDVTLFDAYFSNSNLISGWGHSTWEQGVEIWRAAKLKKMIMGHHNIASSDKDLDDLGATLNQISSDLFIGKDGMVLYL